MEKKLRRILITATSNCTAEMMRQLEYTAQENDVQVQLFDSSIFYSERNFDSEDKSNSSDLETPDTKRQLKKPIFNIDLGEQLKTALIQDTDFHSHRHHLESQSINLPFHENIHRNQLLWYSFQEFIVENEIDSVLFLKIPEGLNDSILYQVSKALKIHVLILCQSPVADRFFSFHSISDCGNYDKNVEFNTEIWQSNGNVTAGRNQQHSPIEHQNINVSNILKVCKFLFKVKSPKLLNPVYILRRAKHLQDAPKNIAHWKDPFAKFFYCQSVAYFEFFTNHHANKIDLNQKFVYFPLQSLTELHSEILDNQFGDQLLALEQLASMLPQNYKIFVKNDPNQDSDYLTPMFFHRIKRICNVVRLPSYVNSEQLIDSSEFVATVSSQEGWEALTKGCKVLVFGKPWYRKLPGAYEYHDELEHSEIVEPEIDYSEFLHHINCLLSQSDTGRLISNDKSNSVGEIDIENSKRVANTIFDLLLGRKETTFQAEST